MRRARALDKIDIRILNELQEDSSVSLKTLSKRVYASPATCQRRIADLRATGVLLKQVVLLDRVKVGLPLTIFVSVELQKQNDLLLKRFESKIRLERQVMACYEVSGEYDFLLIVSASSMESYHAFSRRLFSSINNVRNFKSLFAMNCSKYQTKVPLEHLNEPRK